MEPVVAPGQRHTGPMLAAVLGEESMLPATREHLVKTAADLFLAARVAALVVG